MNDSKLALGLALALLSVPASAADSSLCDLWAKEVVRATVDLSPVPEVQGQEPYRAAIYQVTLSQCLLAEATPEWERDIEALLAHMGSKPAGEPEWLALCRADYRSFRESDGTVIRRGTRKRVPCPHKEP